MMAAALQRIACDNEICHFLIKFIAPPFFSRSGSVFIKIDEGNITHVLLTAPFATSLSRDVASPLLTCNLRLTC